MTRYRWLVLRESGEHAGNTTENCTTPRLEEFPSRWYLNFVLAPQPDKLWSNYYVFAHFPTEDTSRCTIVPEFLAARTPRLIYCSTNPMLNDSKKKEKIRKYSP